MTRADDPTVCILLPVLNERANIEPLLAGISKAMEPTPYVVCIVDDGSKDGTRDVLEKERDLNPERYHLIFRQKKGRGSQRGSALHISLLWGLEDPNNQIFVEMDGDLSHRPEELRAGLDALRSGDANVIIASKYLTASRVTNRSLGRRLVSRICNTAVRLLLSLRVRDYSNGLRFYDRTAAETVARSRIRYGSPIYLSEVMAIWLRAGMRIREVPTTYVGRNEGLSKLRFIDLVKAGLAIFEIAIRLRMIGFAEAKAPVHADDGSMRGDFTTGIATVDE